MLRVLNLRLLLLTLVLLAITGGVIYAYYWRINQPEYLLKSAERYYELANQRREQGDSARAIALYESADRQLQNLLSPRKQPQNAQAWMFRSRVLSQLALLLEKEQSERQDVEPRAKERTADLRRQLWFGVNRVAELDSTHAEANARLMLNFLSQDKIPQAAVFAPRILALQPGDNSDGEWPTYAADQSAARFVMAWMAIHQDKPPQPDAALEHIRRSMEFEAKALSGPGKSAPPPRWRSVALEAQALTLLIEQHRKTASAGRREPGQSQMKVYLDQLRTRLPAWQARVRAELDEPVPTLPVALPSHVHTVASLAVRASPTDAPGLVDVLLLSIQHATDTQQVLERADLAAQVCAKLSSTDKTPELVLREVTRCLLQVSDVALRRVGYLVQVEKNPNPDLVRNPTWADLCERIDTLAEKALLQSGSNDAGAYLALAQNAQRESRQEAALAFVDKGLKAAERSRAEAGEKADPEWQERLARAEAGLHAVAAWSLVVQQKATETEAHLAALKKRPDKSVVAQVHLIEGLRALQEGRLEQAVRELEVVRDNPRYGDTLYPCLGLAHAYLGLGKYDRALANLEKVRQIFERYAQLSTEEKAFADRLLPNPAALSLEFFRCHLGRGHLAEALAYKEHLTDLPEGQTATLLLVQACLILDQLAARGLNTLDRAPFIEAATRELAAARRMAPDDTGLAVAEAKLAMIQPDVNIPVVASALAALAFSPANLGAQVMENLRLRRGLNWHLASAEAIVHEHATRFRDVPSTLAWARWLSSQGRYDEAAGVLHRLEAKGHPPEQKRLIQLERAQLSIRRGQPEEVAQLVEALEQDKPDLATDILAVYYAAEIEKNRPDAHKRLAEAIRRHTGQTLLHFWQGELAQADGDFRQAGRSYARCLQYTKLRAASQRGLLTSLLALGDRESPAAANELITELLEANPKDPALLLAYAENALRLDNIEGPGGMEGALRSLEAVLKEDRQNPALGAYFLARAWQAVGRPDVARKEIDRALQADPQHKLSLLLAGQLALGMEDWGRAIELATVLEAAHPGLAEPLLWRAASLEKLGQAGEAMAVCKQLTEQFPARSEGYLALARTLEKAKDYRTALGWVQAWRDRAPGDLPGLQMHTRLLVLSNQSQEAANQAEQTIVRQLKELEERQAANPNQPANDAREALVQREFELSHAISQGFLSAMAFDRAQAWGQRALALAGQLPEAKRRGEAARVEVVLAEVHLWRAQTESSPARKRAEYDKAIDLYRSIYEKFPGNMTAGNNLAYLLAQERGEVGAALAIVKQVRQGRYSRKPLPGDRLPWDLLDTMGIVFRGARQYDEAVNLFTEAARRYTDEPRLYLHLGRAYAGMKQYRLAIDSLTRATRLAVDQADSTRDPLRKAQLNAVAEEARQDQLKLRGP